ncbi:MAG: hypothetical protein WAS73_14635 [Defluviicoccus sp.]
MTVAVIGGLGGWNRVPSVHIVADYGTDGYRLSADAAGAFPISEALRMRIAAWNDAFERACPPDAYEDITGKRFDFVAFAAQGLEIAKAVKRELPHWRVLYWDEGLDWFLARDPRHQDRARVEYEITLKDAFTPPR